MANIKISQLPSGVPDSSSIFPFVLNSVTYQGYISALTTSNLVSVTLTEFNSLVQNNEILPSKFYLISEVDSELYNGTTILVNGVTTNSASNNGVGIFYNPIYDQSIEGNGIWNRYIKLSVIGYTGTVFTVGETITSDLGGTATFIGGEILEWINGTWTGSMFMTGNTSGTIAEINNAYFQQYDIGDKVIWGGKVWELTTSVVNGELLSYGNGTNSYSGITKNTPIIPTSITFYADEEIFYDNGFGVLIGGLGGAIDYNTGEWSIMTTNPLSIDSLITIDYTTDFVGNNLDKYDLSSIWTAVTYNEVDYNLTIDEIKYDYVHDKIISRKDRFGNEVNCTYESILYFEESYGNPIKDFQWGNSLDNWG